VGARLGRSRARLRQLVRTGQSASHESPFSGTATDICQILAAE
jgi:hypothetical protein